MARVETILNQELTEAVKVRYLDGNIFSADNQANTIIVNVFRNGSPASLSGSVSASIVRADGATISAIGSLSGNAVSVSLPQQAYAVPGPISIVIKLTASASEITTVGAVVANVYQSATDTIVDPGTIIPSIQSLIDAIAQAVSSIPADYSDLWKSLAPNYSNSGTYNLKDYVTYNGHLYRCTTAITSPESWNASHWAQVTLGEQENADYKSLTNNTEEIKNILTHNVGRFFINQYASTNGAMNVAYNGMAQSIILPIIPDYSYTLTGTSGNYRIYGANVYDKDMALLKGGYSTRNGLNSNAILAEYPMARCLVFNVWDGSSTTALTEEGIATWVCHIIPEYSPSLLYNRMNSILIEGFDNSVDVIGTVQTDKFNSGNGAINIVDLAGWNLLTAPVEGGETYFISGAGATGGSLYAFKDSTNHYLSESGRSDHTPTYYEDEIAVAPYGAAYVIVNGYGNTKPQAVKKAITSYQADFEIDGYEHATESVGTKKTGYIMNGVPPRTIEEYALAGWNYITVQCAPGETYQLSGSGGPSVCLYSIFDASGNLLEYGEHPTPVGDLIATVKPPYGSAVMYVNGRNGVISARKELPDFIRSSGDSELLVGTELSPGVWNAGIEKIITNIVLAGSANGAVTFSSMKREGSSFKTVSDDITPINIQDIGYVGGNHGYLFVYTAVLTNHGLTDADIGKTCDINGDTWILLQVNEEDFVVGCLDDSTWLGLKTVETPPTSFNFGSSITVSSISLSQLQPSIKNIKTAIAKNTSSEFAVSESYDIVCPKTGLSALNENIGSNDNNSIAELSPAVVTVRNLYTFSANGACVITQNLKMLDSSIVLNFYGGTQSAPFGSSDYYAVPMTSLDQFQSSGDFTYFNRTIWTDQSTPPIIYCQADNSISSSNKMFVQGVLMDNRNSMLYDRAGFISGERKMYPYAVQPVSSSAPGDTFNITSFRIPMYKNDSDENVRFVGYCNVGNTSYWFCCNGSSVSKLVSVPSEFLGKAVETVIAKNAVCLNTIIATGIDVKFSDQGYILLKITG